MSNSNNSNDINLTSAIVPETYPNKVFPDQSEDSFWQNALEAKEGHKYDAIWDPQRLKEKKETSFVIPPPPLPSLNNCTRHSRNSSKVSWSWGLQTDSERHIELLESKLNDVVSNNGKQTNSKTFVGELECTPLSSLGYYPEENFENEEMELHNPLESDEGLWLLWKYPKKQAITQTSQQRNDNPYNDNDEEENYEGEEESKLNDVVSNNGKQTNSKTFVGELECTPLSSLGYYPEENFENEEMELHNPLESDEGLWLLWKYPKKQAITQTSQQRNDNPYNDNDEEENYEGEEGEDDLKSDTSSIIIDEILLRRKNENDYLWMNGMFENNLISYYCMSSFTFVQSWICCGVWGLEDD
ncbi:hypothetical protein Glove_408g14 [Diversispora epigaea]|uniref:Uncharacterized protein n=1 Tax=Diversispora epigaea TaxID=1348612 RepID=A0A397H295_9GLOM|nr:hypothetical protein Glove_408g14 [Diversispora epigaea]